MSVLQVTLMSDTLKKKIALAHASVASGRSADIDPRLQADLDVTTTKACMLVQILVNGRQKGNVGFELNLLHYVPVAGILRCSHSQTPVPLACILGSFAHNHGLSREAQDVLSHFGYMVSASTATTTNKQTIWTAHLENITAWLRDMADPINEVALVLFDNLNPIVFKKIPDADTGIVNTVATLSNLLKRLAKPVWLSRAADRMHVGTNLNDELIAEVESVVVGNSTVDWDSVFIEGSYFRDDNHARLHDFQTIGQLPGQSSSLNVFVIIWVKALMVRYIFMQVSIIGCDLYAALGGTQEGFCKGGTNETIATVDPEFTYHFLRTSRTAVFDKVKNVFCQIAVFHSQKHLMDILGQFLPFVMLVYISFCDFMKVKPSIINTLLARMTRYQFGTSFSVVDCRRVALGL
jgi:hypothetical protein